MTEPDPEPELGTRHPWRKRLIGIGLAVVTAFVVAIASGAGEAAWVRISDAVGLGPGPSPGGSPHTSPTPTGSPSPSASPNASASPEPLPDPVQIHVYNLLFPGDSGVVPAVRMEATPADRRITVRLPHAGLHAMGDVTSGGALLACPATRLEPAVKVELCRPLTTDREVAFTSADIVEVRVSDRMEATAIRGVPEVDFTFRPAKPAFTLHLPEMHPKLGGSVCKDNACNPFVEITPFRKIHTRATLRWDGGGTGQIAIVAGNIVAGSYGYSGTPYTQLAKVGAPPDVHEITVEADLPARESAIAVSDIDVVTDERPGGKLDFPQLDITWSS